MIEASQKRGLEQQTTIRQLLVYVRQSMPEEARDVHTLRCAALLARALTTEQPPEEGLDEDDRLVAAHVAHIQTAVKKFSRTDEEARELLGEMLKQLVSAGLETIRRQYTLQRIHHEKLLYDGHKADDLVSL